MAKQNYKNHAKYYPAHHFVFYPIVLVGTGISVWYYFKYPGLHPVWLLLAAIFIIIAWLSFMMRQHYSLKMQDRIIRMEMRFRYYVLTQQRIEPLERQLTFGQIAALRFASDEELPALVKRAIAEKLTPDDIKKSVKNWVADDMRV